MAFTYDLSTDIGKVRLLIPDTDATAYHLEDAEIAYLLEQTGGNVKAAAVEACRWLARKFAQAATFKADGLEIAHSERAKVFSERAKELAATLGGAMSTVPLDRADGYSEEADA